MRSTKSLICIIIYLINRRKKIKQLINVYVKSRALLGMIIYLQMRDSLVDSAFSCSRLPASCECSESAVANSQRDCISSQSV
ncbi:hypothetical protein PUN28_006991 [Cardiocondyla obscurior]|uniref:Uncharacterized protein n=1 Tax=Cardiocondyla obscurior TaxID=286306 RepID=A0AAW2G0Q5_9HYME